VPTNFGDAALNGGKDMLKMGKNADIGIHGAFFIRFLCFFKNCNLFRLRNVPTKFGDAAFNGGKDMLKMSKNADIGIHGAFFICFLSFFF
jgi:hypothetical protein